MENRKEFFPVVNLHRKYLEQYFDDEEGKIIIKQLTDSDMQNIADELRDFFWDYFGDTWEDYLYGVLLRHVKKSKEKTKWDLYYYDMKDKV